MMMKFGLPCCQAFPAVVQEKATGLKSSSSILPEYSTARDFLQIVAREPHIERAN